MCLGDKDTWDRLELTRAQMNILLFEYLVTIQLFEYHFEYLNIHLKGNI